MLGVSFALVMLVARDAGAAPCPGDLNGDEMVTVDELVIAVTAALNGCPPADNCGDGVVQPDYGEECEGADLAGQTCLSLGFADGTLSCSDTCEFSTRACTSTDRLLRSGQLECDQGNGTLGACPGAPAAQDGAVRAGIPLGYTDLGDGTIQDHGTGLMWEKLSEDGSIHDWTTGYTWADAFNVKIAALNTPPCFAGYCDWRLPNRRELESLVDAGRSAPAVDPVFHRHCTPGCTVTTCSCTQSEYYWSATSYQDPTLPGFAWNVDFNVGAVNGFDKAIPAYFVRAVRGGT
jgi:hypothetical protein